MKKNIFVVSLLAITVLSIGLTLGCTTATTDTTTTTAAATTTTTTTTAETTTTAAATTTTAAATTTTTAVMTTTTTTTTSTTSTTVLTSGSVTLNYVSATHSGEAFVFANQSKAYESIFMVMGDIINVGSALDTPPTIEGAGIIDMGVATLGAIASAPATGYLSRLDVWAEDAIGHVACVKTTAGKYAKIRVTSHEAGENTTFTFDWIFRTDGSRVF